MLEIKEDIREECARVGDVTNVVLFDKEPDGVASVRFANPEDAKACVRVCRFPLPNFLLLCFKFLCFKFLLDSLLASSSMSKYPLYAISLPRLVPVPH